jgi:hypothetical protein
MPFWPFRRKETLNERLMREAGLPHETGDLPASTEAGRAEHEDMWFGERSLPFFERLSGEVTSPRPRRWDAVVAAEVPELSAHELEFVTLPDGSIVIEADEDEGDVDLTAFADAVERQVTRPYRVKGVRRDDGVWALAARRIEVARFAAGGEEIDLSMHDGVRTVVVDGTPSFGTIPELEAIGRRAGASYVVRATRLDGDLWEVSADPL